MTVKCPPLYSVWENDKGGKIFVEHVYDEATDPEVELEEGDEPQFFVTVVPYSDRNNMDAGADELDAERGPNSFASTESGKPGSSRRTATESNYFVLVPRRQRRLGWTASQPEVSREYLQRSAEPRATAHRTSDAAVLDRRYEREERDTAAVNPHGATQASLPTPISIRD
ncbi:hypothetical protein [Paraburkholderia diazotrophica]|uniref:Uncharacterized protein n=1 Tax=Paraburkholderia diazotrophica TaxID=667676 RepID=A0A1H6TR58_9BURK|nr:hypothetical protein [Paraburkholderia diazotrophica]SEI81746.1 hypothetical protein SAMN05192539_1004201 [Paraburkholderia diazotrophica]